MRRLILALLMVSLLFSPVISYATDVSDPGDSGNALSGAPIEAESVDDLTPDDIPDNTPCGCFYSPPPNTPQVLNNGDPVPGEVQQLNGE